MSLRRLFRLYLASLLDSIYPPICAGCAKAGTFLCPNCYGQIEFFTMPLAPTTQTAYLDQVIICAHYTGPIKKLIKNFKYQKIKNIGFFLGKLIWQTTALPLVDTITSVPLHKHRFKWRGFNQAEIVAHQLAKEACLPYHNLLIRQKNTKPQAGIEEKSKRLKNLAQAFSLNPAYQDKLPNTVLILDDVFTTGTTLNTCAQILKKHGVKKVFGLAVAHGF